MSNLSDRQRHILEFIIDFVNENEFPPTIREIGDRVGISSTSVVNYNLTKLEELGLISRRKEVSRGLSLNWDRIQSLVNTEESSVPATAMLRTYAKDVGTFVDSLMRVPVLGHIAAGEPIPTIPSEPSNTDDWVEVPPGLFRSDEQLFALRVQGDSMIDASVLDGDVVILRPQQTADDGDMVAAWIEGDEETTLKYLHREGRNVRLQPANPNPEYQPIIRPADQVLINGKVVSVIRMLDQ
jgi:repressor LexA